MRMRLARFAVAAILALATGDAIAQQAPAPAQPDPPAAPQAEVAAPAIALPEVAMPNYWDPRRRPNPPTGAARGIRFLTELDYPPFSFEAADGTLIGFNVELARAVCLELAVPCTIQARSWETLLPALTASQGDAVIASLAINADLRRQVALSDRYLANPARFVGRLGEAPEIGAEALAGRRVGVVAGTAHEAYLRAFFGRAEIVPAETAQAARAALREASVDAVFGDGIGLSGWLSGPASEDCCAFLGGPYTESRFFGEGMAIAFRPADETLRQAVNYALVQLNENGTFAELYLKYFPVGFY